MTGTHFATAAWIGRMVVGDLSPWHRLDLPGDEAPGWDGIPWDREARPSLDEQLAATVTRRKPGWPAAEDFPVRECLLIVLNEEWEHRLYAERDLTVLEKER